MALNSFRSMALQWFILLTTPKPRTGIQPNTLRCLVTVGFTMMAGSRAHAIPWLMVPLPPLKDDVWELYNVDEDFSEANNLAAKSPPKLKEMQDLFVKVAEQYHVLPIDDRRAERFNAAIAGRPDLIGDRTSLTVYPGMNGITENAFI